MRIRIELGLKGKRLPRAYQSKIQGFIYQMLEQSEKTQNLHNEGHRVENRPFRLFVFSDLFGDKEMDESKEFLLFHSDAYFEVAAAMDDVVYEMIRYLQKQSKVLLGNQLIDVLRFDLIQYPTYSGLKSFDCYSISPVTVYQTENKRTIYLDPSSEEYKTSILRNIDRKYQIVYQSELELLPEITIRSTEPVSRHFRDQFIQGYHLHIAFENVSYPVFNLLMNTGIGSKNSIGFGMIRFEK